MAPTKKIEIYRNPAGHEPYTEYLASLTDRRGAMKIRVPVERAQLGNLGDHASVGEGVLELRIRYGPGYRVYFGQYGTELIILLCAGDKSSQSVDIQKAKTYWKEWKSS